MNVGSQWLHLGKHVYTSIIILNPLDEIILHVFSLIRLDISENEQLSPIYL